MMKMCTGFPTLEGTLARQEGGLSVSAQGLQGRTEKHSLSFESTCANVPSPPLAKAGIKTFYNTPLQRRCSAPCAQILWCILRAWALLHKIRLTRKTYKGIFVEVVEVHFPRRRMLCKSNSGSCIHISLCISRGKEFIFGFFILHLLSYILCSSSSVLLKVSQS